jgi:hypothetical protein
MPGIELARFLAEHAVTTDNRHDKCDSRVSPNHGILQRCLLRIGLHLDHRLREIDREIKTVELLTFSLGRPAPGRSAIVSGCAWLVAGSM